MELRPVNSKLFATLAEVNVCLTHPQAVTTKILSIWQRSNNKLIRHISDNMWKGLIEHNQAQLELEKIREKHKAVFQNRVK